MLSGTPALWPGVVHAMCTRSSAVCGETSQVQCSGIRIRTVLYHRKAAQPPLHNLAACTLQPQLLEWCSGRSW